LWLKTLLEIGEEAFDQALHQVLENSTFRPDIAEIRRVAGVNRGLIDPVAQEAHAELKRLIGLMRKHGPLLKAIPGRVTRDRDDDGRSLPVSDWVRADEVPAPILEPVTDATIAELGYGSRIAGLEVISRHPALNPATSAEDAPYRTRNAAELERLWVSTYAQCRAGR
jgi:hypothetical protein